MRARRPFRRRGGVAAGVLGATLVVAGSAGANIAAVTTRVPRAAVSVEQLVPGALNGVAATSTKNAWAVGFTPTSTDSHPLVLHFNGSGWTRSPTPVAATHAILWSVAARTSADAWAVGSETVAAFRSKTLILHWNGAAWTRVPAPAPGQDSTLSGVTIVSASNAWAVGNWQTANLFSRPLILHWNGHVWKRLALPRLPKAIVDSGLSAVAASSARNAWAVGSMSPCGCGPGEPLIMRWNGRAWKRQRTPAGSCCFSITGVAAISSRRAFAVGVLGEGDSPVRAQAAQFTRRVWRRQHTPNPPIRHRHQFNGLDDVAAISARKAWAVGSADQHSLIERWNGRAWRQQRVAAAVTTPHSDDLSAVAATSTRDVWAVGSVVATGTNTDSVLVMHWDGAHWTTLPTGP
jgi:hypothetical protein